LIQGFLLEASLSRGDLSDAEWRVLRDLLPINAADRGAGRPPEENRSIIDGILWRLRCGTPWRDAPPKYGNWNTIYWRFRRWSEAEVAIDDALRRLSPKSAMAKALAYGRKRWTVLTRFLDDGRAEIDNNIAERAIRSIAIGRKNWLFAGSKAGGERTATIYSVIETCKLNGIEPHAYIADVIAKIADDWPASRWDELMPWNWTAAQPPVSMAA
jgi:Transposase IS66 family/Putative transposase of IS4/5 family (DUF4096)/IS66 C-terminal element